MNYVAEDRTIYAVSGGVRTQKGQCGTEEQAEAAVALLNSGKETHPATAIAAISGFAHWEDGGVG